MKKTLIITLLIVALVGGLFVLTGCSKGGNTLKAEYDGKEYTVSYKTGAGDKVTVDSESPDMVSIENAEKNYIVDLTLYIDFKDAYESGKTSAKDEVDGYSEVKIGKYDAFVGNGGPGEFFGNILLDTSDDIYKTILFTVTTDGDPEEVDIQEVYNSEGVQNIINSINF